MIRRPPRPPPFPYTTLFRSDRLVRLSRALVGHFPGGLAQINVVLSIFFAGISGSSTADAASQSKIFIEAQRKEGYDDRSEEHTSELQSRQYLVCRLLLEKKKTPAAPNTRTI